MSREEYVAYLRDQALRLTYLAEELESGGKIYSDWLIDWELRYEEELLKQEYKAELDKAAEELEKDVA